MQSLKITDKIISQDYNLSQELTYLNDIKTIIYSIILF